MVVEVNTENIGGYSAVKYLGDDDFSCSLGSRLQPECGHIAIVFDRSMAISIVGGEDFYQSLRSCTEVSQAKKVFVRRLAADINRSPDIILKVVSAARDLTAREATASIQKTIRMTLGIAE